MKPKVIAGLILGVLLLVSLSDVSQVIDDMCKL